jgi:hypothetical protein
VAQELEDFFAEVFFLAPLNLSRNLNWGVLQRRLHPMLSLIESKTQRVSSECHVHVHSDAEIWDTLNRIRDITRVLSLSCRHRVASSSCRWR